MAVAMQEQAVVTSTLPPLPSPSPSPVAPLAFPELREKAIIFEGQSEFTERTVLLFREMGLPENMLPLKDIVESGFVEETGFSWTVTRGGQRHHFAKADRMCSYDTIITSNITKGRMSNIKGVKAKELGLWVPIHEIYVDDSKPNNKKLVFKGIMGLSRSMSFHLFE